MKSIIQKIKKDLFIGNLLVMGMSSMLTIAVGLLFTPFLSRIYSPIMYGNYSIFRAIASNLGMLASLNYVNALLITKTKREFISLFALILCIVIVFCSLLFIPLFLIDSFDLIRNLEALESWLYFIPVFILIIVLNQCVQAWNAHNKNFRRRALATSSGIVGGKSYALLKGVFYSPASSGLIIGEFITLLVDIVIGAPGRMLKLVTNKKFYSQKRLQGIIKSYSKYPKYALPANWINLMNEQLPIYFMGIFFVPEILGQYVFAITLLNLPLTVISKSFSPVFLQRLTELKNEPNSDLSDLVRKLYMRLFFAGLGPFIIFLVFGKWIFLFILGDQWTMAAEFSQILVFMYMLKICTTPLIVLYRVMRKETIFLRLTILAASLSMLGLFIGRYADGVTGSLVGLTISSILYYLISSYFYLRMAEVRNPFRLQIIIVLIVGSLAVVNYIII